jgi:hypothetical protein
MNKASNVGSYPTARAARGIVADWGSIPEWLQLLIYVGVVIGGWASAQRQERSEKLPPMERYYGIPPVLPERLRRPVLAANLLFAAGGYLLVVSLFIVVAVVIGTLADWLVSGFPAFAFTLAAILLAVGGGAAIRVAWHIRRKDPLIGQAVQNQYGWMGVRPETARRIAKLTAGEPDPPEREEPPGGHV